MLEKTDFSVTDISDRVGYSSYNNFSRAFKTHTGVSPTSYRNNNWKSEIELEEVRFWILQKSDFSYYYLRSWEKLQYTFIREVILYEEKDFIIDIDSFYAVRVIDCLWWRQRGIHKSRDSGWTWWLACYHSAGTLLKGIGIITIVVKYLNVWRLYMILLNKLYDLCINCASPWFKCLQVKRLKRILSGRQLPLKWWME